MKKINLSIALSLCLATMLTTNTFAGSMSNWAAKKPAQPTAAPCNGCGNPINGIEEGVYSIKLKKTKLFLDVAGANDKNGASLHAWRFNYHNAQLWHIFDSGGKKYVIRNLMSGKVLEVAGSAMNNGSKVQIWDYANIPTQKWKINPSGADGAVKIINVNSGLALGLSNNDHSEGNAFHGWLPESNKRQNEAQRFELIKRW